MADRFIQFSVAISKLNKQIQKLKTDGMQYFDLKGTHTLCLYQLLEHPEGMSFSQVAAGCDLDQALVSRTLAVLTQKELVEKSGLPGKYNALYRLTPKGEAVVQQIRSIISQIQTLADQGITSEDLSVFYRVLYRLLANFQDMADHSAPLFSPLEQPFT